jgi:hypothetical protein
MSTKCSKHVENWNKRKRNKKKELCVKLVIYQNYTEMHGQQNITCHCPFTFPTCINKDEGHTLRTVGKWLAIPEYPVLVTCLARLTSLGDLKTQVLWTENIGVFSELRSAQSNNVSTLKNSQVRGLRLNFCVFCVTNSWTFLLFLMQVKGYFECLLSVTLLT